MKEDYDGAEPTASSVSVLNLLTLSHLVDDAAVGRSHRAHAAAVRDAARADGPRRADDGGRAVRRTSPASSRSSSSERRDGGATRLDRAVATRYLPFAIQLRVTAGDAARARRQPAVCRRDAAGATASPPPTSAATSPAGSRSRPSTRSNRNWGSSHDRVRRRLAARHRHRHHRRRSKASRASRRRGPTMTCGWCWKGCCARWHQLKQPGRGRRRRLRCAG